MRRLSCVVFASVLVLIAASRSHAQQAAQSNTGSTFGTSSLFGGTSGANSAIGQGDAQAGAAQSAFGQGAAAANGGNQQGFVGRDAADAAAFFQALGSNAANGQAVRRQFNNNANRGRGAEVNQDSRPPVRVELRLGFAPGFERSTARSESLDRILRSVANKGLADVAVRLEAGRVTLEGSVPTASDRGLVERIARLEPGVSKVDNQLTINAMPTITPATGRSTVPEEIPPGPST